MVAQFGERCAVEPEPHLRTTAEQTRDIDNAEVRLDPQNQE